MPFFHGGFCTSLFHVVSGSDRLKETGGRKGVTDGLISEEHRKDNVGFFLKG